MNCETGSQCVGGKCDACTFGMLTDLQIIDIAKATGVYGTDHLGELIEFAYSIEQRVLRNLKGENCGATA